MKATTSAALAALYAASPAAARISHCPGSESEACFQWVVPPSSSSSSSSNPVYFQLAAPSTYQWTGLAIGNGMSGAQFFIMYKDGSGNVTLSTRTAPGHVQPSYEKVDGVELLAGSGVENGKMVANVKCSGDCSSKLDTSGTNSWIAAWQSDGDLSSKSMDADIQQHNSDHQFRVNLADASINSDGNPFVGSQANDNSGSPNSNNDNNSSSDSDSGGAVSSDSSSPNSKIILAHGIVMAVTFAILYPIGAILMPLIGRWLVHGIVQFVAFLAMWAGFGLGYHYAKEDNSFFNSTHTRLGTIVVALLGIQPILGWVHHSMYKRYQRRTLISHLHIWYGRILMALGIVNGGLGLQDHSASMGYKIAYAVVAGVLGGLYIGAAIWGMIKRRRGPRVSSKSSGSSG